MPATKDLSSLAMVTMNEVTQLLCVTRRTLERWVEMGQFPQPVRLGAKIVRFRRTDVEAYLRKQQQK